MSTSVNLTTTPHEMPILKKQTSEEATQNIKKLQQQVSVYQPPANMEQPKRAVSKMPQMSLQKLSKFDQLIKAPSTKKAVKNTKFNVPVVSQQQVIPEQSEISVVRKNPQVQEYKNEIQNDNAIQIEEDPPSILKQSFPAAQEDTNQFQRQQSVLHLNEVQQEQMPTQSNHGTNAFTTNFPKRPPNKNSRQSEQQTNNSQISNENNSLVNSQLNQSATLSEFKLQHFTPIENYKKLELNPKKNKKLYNNSYINNQLQNNARQLIQDFSEDKLKQTIQQLQENEITLDVRRLQAALFVSEINATINDFHKALVGSDLTSSLPHYLWMTMWCILLGASITLLIVFGAVKTFLNILSYLFYVFISLEYILMFAALKTGQYAKKPIVDEEKKEKVKNGKICLVIPVGWGINGLTDDQKCAKRQGKIDVLTNTLDAAIGVFDPTDIYVFHNSNDQQLPDEVMMQCCSGRSVYVPVAIGSKSISAYYGAMLGNWLGYEYVIVMDDDTRLPVEMPLILNQPLDCDAYCFAIAAASNDDPAKIPNSAKLIIALQDIEYKLSDLSKLTQYNFTTTSSVLAPHGAINMWRTDILVDIMHEHNCIFHGEDYQMGLIMRNRHPRSRLGIISNCIVNTVAPSNIKDLYMQRYTSWDLAAQQFLWGGFCASQRSAHYMQVLFCLPCTIDNLFIRVTTLEDIWTVLQDYIRVILIAYHIIFSIVYRYLNIVVIIMYLLVLGSQWVIAFALQYVKFKQRPDLQLQKDVKLKAILLFPIYRFLFSFVRVLALLRFFFKFESVKRNAQPIKQMSLPQPKQLQFAFPGLKTSDQDNNKKQQDSQMIQQIVQYTLNQTKYLNRKTSLAQFPVVISAKQDYSEPSRANLVPQEKPPIQMKQNSNYESRYKINSKSNDVSRISMSQQNKEEVK